MESIINNIANLPPSWSILFILFAVAITYYWYNILPKMRVFNEQESIIRKIIPLIGSDITKLEEILKNHSEILVKVSSICTKLESGMAVALREENEIKRLIMTEMRQFVAPAAIPQPYSIKIREDPRYTAQGGSPLDEMSIGQIKALLSRETMEKVTEVNIDRLRNALSYLESEVPNKPSDSPMELDKLLSKY